MNLDDIVKILQKECVGETMPLKALIITISGCKCINKDSKNTNIHCDDESGIGKDYITEVVKKYIFPDKWIHEIMPSPAAITMTQRPISINGGDEIVPNPITKDSIVYIEDADDKFLSGRHFKMLINGDVNNYPLVDSMKAHLVSWPKPIVIISTATGSGDNQVVRRLPSLKFDNSPTQTKKIMDFIVNKSCNKVDLPTKKEIKDINDYFNSLDTVYADCSKLEKLIRDEIIRDEQIHMRSLTGRFLDYIKFSATLHQHNRVHETTGGPHMIDLIYANEDDFNIAKDVIYYMYKEESEKCYSTLNHRQRHIAKRLEREMSDYTVDQINTWPESGDVTMAILYKDIKKICQQLPHINGTGSQPTKYGVGESD